MIILLTPSVYIYDFFICVLFLKNQFITSIPSIVGDPRVHKLLRRVTVLSMIVLGERCLVP